MFTLHTPTSTRHTSTSLTRRIAVAATAALCSFGMATPAASAQDLGTILGGVSALQGLNDSAIATVDCKTLDMGLTALKLKDSTTTQAQLEKNIRTAVPAQGLPLVIFKAEAASKWASRALECGLVKPNPQTPLSGSAELLGSLDIAKEVLATQR